MANGYKLERRIIGEAAVTVGASATAELTDTFLRSAADSDITSIVATIASLTAGAGITLKLQGSWDNGTTWTDEATLALTTTGVKEIHYRAGWDGAAVKDPLPPLCRVVVTTTAGSALGVSQVLVSKRM